MRNSLIKDYGIGVGLRAPHLEHFLNERPKSVCWLEVVSENYMPWSRNEFGSNISTLEKLRVDYPIALHGVSMNLGSADPLDMDYLAKLRKLELRIEPFIVSDHLAWTGVRGENLHDLLPLPYTRDNLLHIASKIARVQEFLGRRILIENPSSYLDYQYSEMSEAEFIKELLKITDCNLLLDVNNVYVSSVNHKFNPIEYMELLPANRIAQIHLAGHSSHENFLIDTHDAPVCKEVWALYIWCLNRIGKRSVMIERDGNIPGWQEIQNEIEILRGFHDKFKASL